MSDLNNISTAAEIIGYIAGAITTTCLLPQVVHIIRNKSSNDVSLLSYVLLATGVSMWFIYGILQYDLRIIITNAVSFVLCLFIILLTISYKSK